MQHRRFYLLAGALALAIILGFALSVPRLEEVGAPAAKNLPLIASSTPIVYLHDSYSKGTHTINGKVLVADACTLATASASLEGASSTPTILISLDIPSDTGTCLAEPATTTFSATIAAPMGAALNASINGSNASTSRY